MNQHQQNAVDQPFLLRIDGSGLERELSAGCAYSEWDADALVASFHDLPCDAYFPKETGCRRRRFSRFSFHAAREHFAVLRHEAFHQPPELNKIAGGIERWFSPLGPTVKESVSLRVLVTHLVSRIPEWPQEWDVNIHQFRVETTGEFSSPAPEGIHSDGHDYIAIVAIQRSNITGGRNRVFDDAMTPLLETVLEYRFDTLLIDDRRTFHDVSPIELAAGTYGHRDMLVIDFNKRVED